jgi:hypothetical protein
MLCQKSKNTATENANIFLARTASLSYAPASCSRNVSTSGPWSMNPRHYTQRPATAFSPSAKQLLYSQGYPASISPQVSQLPAGHPLGISPHAEAMRSIPASISPQLSISSPGPENAPQEQARSVSVHYEITAPPLSYHDEPAFAAAGTPLPILRYHERGNPEC